jgi:protein-S-isoprenylcysteine O-methyltransferase Ste14
MTDPIGDITAEGGGSMTDPWFLAGCTVLGGFLLLEASTRKPGAASSLEVSDDDKSTTRTVAATYAAAAMLVPLVRLGPGAQLPRTVAIAGLGFEGLGLVIRAWSMRTLGHAYTRTLRVADDQQVVDTGPYRLVRHPGYLGSMATWTGFAMTSRRSLGVLGVIALLGRAYSRRIEAEETLLAATLSGYDSYMRRTWRLVPGIW